MATTLASTARTARTIVAPGTGSPRVRGAAPLARPVLGGPTAAPVVLRTASRRPGAVAACRVVSPATVRAGLLLKIKVAIVATVALVGMGASVAEFASWSQPDPSVEFVSGDPAWAHVDGL
ncbi:hypothetical protein [Tessaracoccus sp.]